MSLFPFSSVHRSVVVELSTSIDVIQKRLGEGFRRVESILVVVVHLCLSFLDKFVQFLLDERGEIQVVILNPLLLVVSDGDGLSCCHIINYVICIQLVCGWRGTVGRSARSVCETMTALYPLPTAPHGRFAPCVAP
jgi:hypothetical protein